jgi:hypothetical protein
MQVRLKVTAAAVEQKKSDESFKTMMTAIIGMGKILFSI